MWHGIHVMVQGGGKRIELTPPGACEGSLGGARLKWSTRPTASGVRLCLELDPGEGIELERAEVRASLPIHPATRILANGYQSWTATREFRPEEPIPGLPMWLRPLWKRHRLEVYGDVFMRRYSSRPYDHHAYSYMGLRNPDDSYRLMASLDESGGYTEFRLDSRRGRIRVSKDLAGVRFSKPVTLFDLVILEGDESQLYQSWFAEMKVKPPRFERLVGWTSWYLHYVNISEQVIRENLQAFSAQRIPLDVFQIDDGWQCAVGDWLDVNEKFSGGMKALAGEIRAAGYRPGLWLAPFVCDTRSRILREHPQWLLRRADGTPVEAGANDMWKGPFYALDPDHPEVQAYLREVFRVVTQEWGFEMVKLDFLYAASLVHKPGRPRAAVMGDAMRFLRDAVGDRLILGCGVPLEPSFGIVDFCRIGPDVSLGWEERAPALIHFRERISTITAITNAMGRRHLDGRAFVNDPDVFLLRDHDTTLTRDERHTLFVANALFGNLLFTSDDVRRWTDEAWKLFRGLFPVVRPTIHGVRSLDGIYEWKPLSVFLQVLRGVRVYANVYYVDLSAGNGRFVAIFNLGNRTVNVASGVSQAFDGENILGKQWNLAPRSVRLARCLEGAPCELMGGVGHLFPGLDVQEWKVEGRTLQVKWHERCLQRQPVQFRVSEPGEWMVNGEKVEAEAMSGGWRLIANPRGESNAQGEV